MIIWLSGPTGSGKTSLAAYLSELGYSAVREEAPRQLFENFASDPARHCAPLQEAIMRARHTQFSLLKDTRKVVFDRSIDEDFAVFCRMHHASGNLAPNSFSRLEDLAMELKNSMPPPDLIIYLSAKTGELVRRLTALGHPKPILDNLDEQLRLYDEWISERPENVIKVDNSKCAPETLNFLFAKDIRC